MKLGLAAWIWNHVTNWLTRERESDHKPLYDFEQLCYEVRPGDVILVEGSSRVSEVIKTLTQSPWSHSALYIGRLADILEPELKQRVQHYYQDDPNVPLIIEAYLGEGTIVNSIEKYRDAHLRICRPIGLTPQDARSVIRYAINRIGTEYHVRQILDLFRFLFPYSILPRRWRSTLFQHNAGVAARTVCSTMLSEAFHSVHFPILPIVEQSEDGKISLYNKNPRLLTPRDFDYSPYFNIIKYPMFGFDDVAIYRRLPWNKEGMICHRPGDCYLPEQEQPVQPDYLAKAEHPPIRHRINLLRLQKGALSAKAKQTLARITAKKKPTKASEKHIGETG